MHSLHSRMYTPDLASNCYHVPETNLKCLMYHADASKYARISGGTHSAQHHVYHIMYQSIWKFVGKNVEHEHSCRRFFYKLKIQSGVSL